MDVVFGVNEKLENISRIIMSNGKAVLYRLRKSGHYKVGEFGYDDFFRIYKYIECNNATITANTVDFLHDFELAGVKKLVNGIVTSAYIDDVNFYKIRGCVKCIEEIETVDEVKKGIDI